MDQYIDDHDLSQYFSPAPKAAPAPASVPTFDTRRYRTKAATNGFDSQCMQQPFQFPAFRNILWDRTAASDSIHSASVEQFLPTVIIPFNVISQVREYTQVRKQPASGSFVGRYRSNGESYFFVVDKFLAAAPRDEITESDHLYIQVVSDPLDMESIALTSLKDLQSRDFPHLSKFMKLWCTVSSIYADSGDICSVKGHIVAPSTLLNFVPVNSLRIVNNPLGVALQKGNLAVSPHLSFQFGYLTLDQFRNAVAVLHNDPMAFDCPLIGIWVYGQECDISLQSIHLWSSCMRFLYNADIRDRVSPEPMTFLVLLAHPGLHGSSFFECKASPSSSTLSRFEFGSDSITADSPPSVSFRWKSAWNDPATSEFLSSLAQVEERTAVESAYSNWNSGEPLEEDPARASITQYSESVPPALTSYLESKAVLPHLPQSFRSNSLPVQRSRASIVPPAALLRQPSRNIGDNIGSKNPSTSVNTESALEFLTANETPDEQSSCNHDSQEIIIDQTSNASIRDETISAVHNRSSGLEHVSPRQLIQLHQRQFELLQQQVASLQQSFERETQRLQQRCCCHSSAVGPIVSSSSLFPPVLSDDKRNVSPRDTLAMVQGPASAINCTRPVSPRDTLAMVQGPASAIDCTRTVSPRDTLGMVQDPASVIDCTRPVSPRNTLTMVQDPASAIDCTRPVSPRDTLAMVQSPASAIDCTRTVSPRDTLAMVHGPASAIDSTPYDGESNHHPGAISSSPLEVQSTDRTDSLAEVGNSLGRCAFSVAPATGSFASNPISAMPIDSLASPRSPSSSPLSSRPDTPPRLSTVSDRQSSTNRSHLGSRILDQDAVQQTGSDIDDIPRIRYVVPEDSSDDDIDAITIKYLRQRSGRELLFNSDQDDLGVSARLIRSAMDDS